MSTDLQNPEGGAEQASQELPIPKLESASPVSATSSVDTEALAAEILKRLDPILDKKLQSTKDKRIARLEKQVGLDELEELGVTLTPEMKTELRFRQLEGATKSPTASQPTPSQGSGETLTAQDVSEVVKNLNLDANDAQVLEKLRGTYRNRDHFEAEMAKVALGQINKQPTSPAASTTLNNAPSKNTISEAEADTKYGQLGALLKNPTQNAAKIKAITEELKDAGYEV